MTDGSTFRPLRRLTLAALALGLAAPAASAAGPIRIGEISSYTGPLAAFTVPYRNGWQLAVGQINAKDGIDGRKLEIVSRDDGGKPVDAVRIAGDLVKNGKVDLLAGTYLSNVALAVSDFAARNKVLFVASEPLSDALVWSKGNRYTFRLRPSTYMQAAMLADRAAKLPLKRWVTVAPDNAYGHAAVKTFRKLLKARRSDVEFVAQQWPALSNIDAGATVQALTQAQPDAIFNATFSSDLDSFVREGQRRGLFKGRTVVSMLTGEPEYLASLKGDTPDGWIVTGYPWDQIDSGEHAAFRSAYEAKYKAYPRFGSLVGYSMVEGIAAMLRKAGSTDTDAMISAMKGLTFGSPIGPITFRAIDHQSTMGAYVGKLARADGHGVMVDWHYADGSKFLPTDAEVKKLRPAQ